MESALSMSFTGYPPFREQVNSCFIRRRNKQRSSINHTHFILMARRLDQSSFSGSFLPQFVSIQN